MAQSGPTRSVPSRSVPSRTLPECILEAYRGIVFDFNGTLFWDTAQHNAAWKAFGSRFGLALTDELLFARVHGKTNDRILADLFGGRLTHEQMQAASDEKEALYRGFCLRDGLGLAPGVERFLDALRERDFPFTIATASVRVNVDFYFEHLRLGRWFDYGKVVFHDGTLPGKPDPTVYLRAMSNVGLEPAGTLIFEDSPSGIQAAINARAAGLIIVNSNNDDYAGYDFPVIRSFEELLPRCGRGGVSG